MNKIRSIGRSHEFWGKESGLQLSFFLFDFEEKSPAVRLFVKKFACRQTDYLGEYSVFDGQVKFGKIVFKFNENQASFR